jgi:sulfite exporter TauE/SafE
MVMSYALKGADTSTWRGRLTPNVAYQGAKIMSYMLVGFALGAIGSAFNLDALRPYVMLAAGAFMLVLGLGMTGRVPWAQRLTPRPPKFLMTALMSVRRKANADAAADQTTIATPILFGLLTGLFPCAPLQAAQLSAAAAGSWWLGGMAMLAFGLGTMPLMLAFGTGASMLSKQFKARIMTVLAIVVMVFGVVYLNRGLMLIGSPVTFNTAKQAVLGGPAQTASSENVTTGEDGVAEVRISIQDTQFVPANVKIPADKPVRLIVDRQEDNACSDQIALPQLGVLKDLAPFAETAVDLPATKAGNYTLTCGMGMMSGQLQVGAGAPASSGGSGLGWLLFAGAAAAGALYYAAKSSPKKAQTAPAAKGSAKKGSKKASSTGSDKTRNGIRPETR